MSPMRFTHVSNKNSRINSWVRNSDYKKYLVYELLSRNKGYEG